MIITCPSCEKKFEIDATLIPEKGRTLECGSCGNRWFYQINSSIQDKTDQITEPIKSKETSNFDKPKNFINNDYKNIENTKNLKQFKNDQLDKEKNIQKVSYFGFKSALSILIVGIISFISFIILLDTFKNPLIKIYPELELILFNLFETLKDIFLFIENLLI